MLRDYTIQAVLGHGGFGIVYKARHNELDHVVAIKEYLPSELAVREGATVRAKSADCETYFADGLRRFREEAKALIDFQRHPSTVACSDFFRAGGTAYLVMEYVDGQPLSQVLREREAAGEPFTESDLLAIAVPLAEGLAHIHRAGVIHRDIKPANILVRRADRQPVLIDFGAAKQAVAEHSRSLAPYTEGYAALEQVADGRLGPWTDLYGYGAVLWRMVAGGNRPWEPPNPVKVESRANARVREADDPLPRAKELGAGRFAEGLLEMIDGCLELRDTERLGDTEPIVGMLQARGGREQVFMSVEPRVDDCADSVQPESVSEEAKLVRTRLPELDDPEFLADLNKPRQPVTDRREGARDATKGSLRKFLAMAAQIAAILTALGLGFIFMAMGLGWLWNSVVDPLWEREQPLVLIAVVIVVIAVIVAIAVIGYWAYRETWRNLEPEPDESFSASLLKRVLGLEISLLAAGLTVGSWLLFVVLVLGMLGVVLEMLWGFLESLWSYLESLWVGAS